MKLPRDVSGVELARALATLGYRVTRQSGSHMRITTEVGGEHHEVIPRHDPLKIGTLQSILRSIARHHGIQVPELIGRLHF